MLFYGENTLLLSYRNAQLASTRELCHINIHENSDWDISAFSLYPSWGREVGLVGDFLLLF